MPPVPNPTARQEAIQRMLEALKTPVKELSKWEENFLESVAEQFETRHSLSERQYEILDNLYSEKTG
jgi:hypothetical protein